MDLPSEVSEQHTLQTWKSHQHADGRLAAALVVAATITTIVFFCAPSAATAWVMVLFLVALGASCLRLLSTTAKLAGQPTCLTRNLAPQPIDGQILDVYECPAASGAPIVRTAAPLWLAPSPQSPRKPYPQPRVRRRN